MRFKVLFDQGFEKLAGCTHQPNEGVISFACSLKHNETNELAIVHQFNLYNHFMFLHLCSFVDKWQV
jgi:hypothetical protein